MDKHTRPSIAAVLEAYGTTIPGTRGGWIPIRCPFHGDSHASATVNLDAGKFHCHGCDVKGDAYDLIQAKENCDFKQALVIGDGFAACPTTQGQRPLEKQYKPRGRRGRTQ